jgi:RNA polymerase sigma-70 factor (ECF subfamily)
MTPVLAHRLRTDRSFERIYRRHVGDVYRYALAVLRQPADAEDVTQTTFMNAYRAFQRGERPRNAQNWLIAIAHNVCRQRFRQAARRPDEVEYDDGIAEVIQEDEDGPSAEDIQRALGHLAFNQRAALVMRELEGRSYAEIGEILGLSLSAVETLLFRARRALREQLEGSLTCTEAERAISRRVDGRLSRAENASLRAHLRECKECERFARSQRAHRKAFKALAAVPVPTSLASFFGGGGGAAVGGGVALKAAAFVTAGVVATGVGYESAKHPDVVFPHKLRSAAPAQVEAAPVPSAAAARDEHVAVVAPQEARSAKAPKKAKAETTGRLKPKHAAKKSHGASSQAPTIRPGRAKHAATHGRSNAAAKKPHVQHVTKVRHTPRKAPKPKPTRSHGPRNGHGSPPSVEPLPTETPQPQPDPPAKKPKVLPELPVELPVPTP